ncbi:Membrane protein involved in the export of O-antigen and teichoic acid [Flavobacteriaceae bacterium MAR_2010_188]|nr:Membrane protein involved in the export of O-antigen and teichoic acid [Flavobacteriaceae bacterium MAR_2010_188]
MGIVSSQSLKNTVTTYIGFAIGGVNALFLFTNFLEDQYYGLISYILSTANIMMPLMAFGVQNTLIKFFNSYKTKNNQNSFLTLMLLLPLLLIIPITIITIFGYDVIAGLLSQKNEIVNDYVWHILIAAISMAYFEVFYAWAKAHMKSVFGNFLKEVFHRFLISALLIGVYFKWLSVEGFILAAVLTYVLRMLMMQIYAFSLRLPRLRFKKIDNTPKVLKYSFLIMIAGSIATVILDIDKFMLGQMIEIENVAYYSVAIYIATVVAVPQRAMHQILLPLTAKFLDNKDKESIDDLYRRSSLTLFIIGGFIFLMIILNVNELYKILPPEYSVGTFVVLIICVAKLYDNLLGNNNAILFNSDYYRMVLFFGILLTVLAVVLNYIFIPIMGINGSAIATLISIFIYNTVKLLFVNEKFGLQPITRKTINVAAVICIFIILFYYWDFWFNPYVNIILKSSIIGLAYFIIIYKFKFSEDVNALMDKMLKIFR